uniref:Beta-ketoacyl synthase C-terminal domain-containing protein n=1 Tax=Alexandrium monilatum TaxID=311494 RepID=A0A6T1IA36_9DINO
MMTHEGAVREHPLVKTSSKSNLGHTEMCAGMLGIMKCVVMGNQAASAPNLHLHALNPHMDTNAYPVYFSSEFVDQGKPVGYFGVSSFGFGGSNARGDIWARAQTGYMNTNPGNDLLDLSFNRICKFADLFHAQVVKPGKEPHLAKEDWEELTGDYLTGDPFEGANAFYCEGSFNGWRSTERMHYLEDKGGHAFAFAMGDTLMEQFRIVCNRFDDAIVFPAAKMADQEALVLGPGEAPAGYRWLVDVRDTARQGAVLMIIFSYDAATKQKRVTWEISQDERAKALADSLGRHKHEYQVVGSWNNFQPQVMRRSTKKPGAYEFEFRIGLYGHEEFRFMRDGDKFQTIYPAKNRSLTRDVPVRGPDHFAGEKYWSCIGETGDLVRLELQVAEGDITVTTENSAQGSKVFKSLRGSFRRRYFVYSQWTDWGFTPMGLDPRGAARVYRLEFAMPDGGPQSFQIVVDEDVHQAFHPELGFADQLMSPTQGPDAKGPGLCWSVDELPGSLVEITLNLATADRMETVTWKVVGGGQAALTY